MSYRLIGVNHRSAPVEVRERLALPESRLADAMRAIVAQPGIREAVILSTCNRVEMLTSADDGSDPAAALAAFGGLRKDEITPHLYELRDQEAIRHLFRVAASLDSMVVGEPQILGQVKEAYALGRSLGSVQGQLDALLTRAFAVAKRVRNETSVGSSSVNVASVAVELAKKIFGSLNGKNVCLVGAGKMSELAARHLKAHGAGRICVVNRTYERAEALAARFSGEAARYEQVYEAAAAADILLTSTGASEPIFRREHGERFRKLRHNRPMFIIDIAVPRDVAPEVNDLDGIFLYDIDDLQTVASAHAEDRQKEAAKAEAIVAEEVRRFLAREQDKQVVPTIISLQEHFETIRQAEIDKVRGRLGPLSPEQELALESLTRGIVNKLLHTPMTALKSAARDKDEASETFIDSVRKLFNLETAARSARAEAAEEQKKPVEVKR